MKLLSKLEEALFLIRSVAAVRNPSSPETGSFPGKWPLTGEERLVRWTEDGDNPDFLEKAGVTCREWRAHVHLALYREQPKTWTDFERVIDGTRCLVKHSLSPFGRSGLLGVLQYVPLKLRSTSRNDRMKAYAALPAGIYSLDAENTFLSMVAATGTLAASSCSWRL